MPKTAPPTGPAFCSTRDAAELLGVSVKTAQAWAEAGVLRAWKTPGGHRRITRESVDALLAKRPPPAATPTPSAAVGCLVVAVDDDPGMRHLYELNIGFWQLPLRLITASNGTEGLLRIGEFSPQILITDLKMPDMDGFQILRILRATAHYKALQIFVVSALSAAEIKDRGGLPDGVEFFPKPLVFERLRRRVESVVHTVAARPLM